MKSSILCAFFLLIPSLCLRGGEVEVLLEKAELARKEKHPEEALRLFRDLLARAPDHLEAHFGYQKLLQSQGKEPELVKEYEVLAEKKPEPWALFLLGRVLHDPVREEGLYRRALEKSPGDFRCRLALGSALERQLRGAEAEKEYRECLRLEPDSFEAHSSLMVLFDSDGKMGELLPEYRERAEKAAGDWRAQLLYGKALGTAQDWEGSWRKLERARELTPAEPEVLASIANYHLKRNQLDQAQPILDKLLRDEPFHARGLMLSGMLKILRKDPGGKSLIEEAVRLEPGESDDFLHLGGARLVHGDLPGAETALREAVRLNGANALAVANMGTIFMLRRQPAQALEFFEKAIRLRPKTAEYRIRLAEACEKLGKNDRARAEREAAEKLRREFDLTFKVSVNGTEILSPPLARAHEMLALASALVIEGKFEEATARFEEAIRAAPDLDAAYWRLARVERRRGRLKEALAFYSRLEASLEERKRSPEEVAAVLAAQADCRYELGERQEAVQLWRAARDKLPEGPGRSHFDELIRGLEAPDPRAGVFRIKDLRIAECTQPNWCVPRSVAAVLSHWKIPTELEKLAGELGVDAKRGTSIAALLDALKQRSDVKAACFSFRPALVKGLLKKGYPVIWSGVALNDEGDYSGHASVVAGFDDLRGIFLLEDSNWFAEMDHLHFSDVETAQGILIAPPAQFDAVVETLPDRRFWDLFDRADALIGKDPTRAETLLLEAVSLKSDEYLSQLYLGYVYEATGRLDAALEAYRRADGLPGADARVNSRMARVLLRTGKVEEAEKTLKEGLKRGPTFGPVLAKLLEIAWKVRKDAAQALPYCERLLAAVPDTGELLFTKGRILLALDRYNEAIESFTWAANVDGPAEANLYLGQLLRAKGERRRAIEALEKYASQVKDKAEAEQARQTIEEIRKEEKAKGH